MVLNIENGAPRAAYLVISENYYKDWMATIDGQDAQVVQGNGTLLTIPVPAGARRVELHFESAEFKTGVMVTFASLVVAMLAMVVPPASRRRQGG